MTSLFQHYERAVNENIQLLAKRLNVDSVVDAGRLLFKRTAANWEISFWFHWGPDGDWKELKLRRQFVGDRNLERDNQIEYHNIIKAGSTSGPRRYMDSGNIIDAYEETAKLLFDLLQLRRPTIDPDLGGKGHLQINRDGTYEFEYQRWLKVLEIEHKLEGHILVDPIRG